MQWHIMIIGFLNSCVMQKKKKKKKKKKIRLNFYKNPRYRFIQSCYVTIRNLSHFGKRRCISWNFDDITKPRLYNFDPLKAHFYIVKLGFTGVYIIFLISAQKHRLWVLVRTALSRLTRRFERAPTIYVLSRNMKNIRIFI